MKNIFVSLVVASLLMASNAFAQCTKDTDCKGTRICKEGACIEETPEPAPAPAPAPVAAPAPAPAPAAAPAPAPALAPAAAPAPAPMGSKLRPPEPFAKGYGTLGFIGSFHGWGKWFNDDDGDEEDGSLQTEFAPGFYLAGLAAVSPSFHIGGYFYHMEGDADPEDSGMPSSVDMIIKTTSLGLSLKAGGYPAPRLFASFALDLGVEFVRGRLSAGGTSAEFNTLFGLSAFPRVNFDIILLNVGFKLAVNVGVGALIHFHGGKPMDSEDFGDNDDISQKNFAVGPALVVGLDFGG